MFPDYIFKRYCNYKNPWPQIWIWIRVGFAVFFQFLKCGYSVNKILYWPHTYSYCFLCPVHSPISGGITLLFLALFTCYNGRHHGFTTGPYLSGNRQYAQVWVLDSSWANQLSTKILYRSQEKFYGGFLQETEQEHVNLEFVITKLSTM